MPRDTQGWCESASLLELLARGADIDASLCWCYKLPLMHNVRRCLFPCVIILSILSTGVARVNHLYLT